MYKPQILVEHAVRIHRQRDDGQFIMHADEVRRCHYIAWQPTIAVRARKHDRWTCELDRTRSDRRTLVRVAPSESPMHLT